MRKISIVILVFVIGTLFSSCMMMMPAHMSGSMEEGHNHQHTGGKIDPVCGKYVDEGTSFTYEYKENTYYFESEQCLAVFKNDPDHFIQKKEVDSRKRTWATVGMIGGAVAMTAMMVLMMTAIF